MIFVLKKSLQKIAGLINVFDEYSANFYLRYIGQTKCLKCLTLFCIYERVSAIVFQILFSACKSIQKKLLYKVEEWNDGRVK
ncbi:MAG: hypothetical protein KAX05_14005, partial [Bacteroidales bacterium]|nr:hypothetical protein [Bacteroidales bacterium]